MTFSDTKDSFDFRFEEGLTSLKEKCFYDADPKMKHKMSVSDWALVAKSLFRIGFSTAQVILSIGEPDDINRTVTSGMIHEQWVYDRRSFSGYVYFVNGKLKSWQD